MSATRILLLAVVVSAGTFVLAQQQTEFDKLKAGKFTGTVQAVQRIPNGIQIVGVEPFAQPPKPIYIMVAPQFLTSVKITGEAEMDAIKTGMYAKFSANLKEDGTIEGPVTEMYIYTPFDKPAEIAAGEAVEVAGKIVSNNRKGMLMLATEGSIRRVKVEVTPETKIYIDVSDLSLVRPGDKIDMTGKQNKVNKKDVPNQLIAQTILVEMANVLTTKKPKKGEEPKKVDPFAAGAKEAEKKKEEEKKK